MAKLQGHFLKHKKNPQEALEDAKSLLDADDLIQEMSITDWLRRLNLQEFAPKFKKEGGVKRVSDLRYISEGDLTTYGIKALTDRKRIMEMMQGNEKVKMLFDMQTRSQARTILSGFLQDSRKIEEVLDLVGDEQMTGYQLRDILDENKNFFKIIKKIKQKVEYNE